MPKDNGIKKFAMKVTPDLDELSKAMPYHSNHAALHVNPNGAIIDFFYIDNASVEKAKSKGSNSIVPLLVTKVAMPPAVAKKFFEAALGAIEKNEKDLGVNYGEE